MATCSRAQLDGPAHAEPEPYTDVPASEPDPAPPADASEAAAAQAVFAPQREPTHPPAAEMAAQERVGCDPATGVTPSLCVSHSVMFSCGPAPPRDRRVHRMQIPAATST